MQQLIFLDTEVEGWSTWKFDFVKRPANCRTYFRYSKFVIPKSQTFISFHLLIVYESREPRTLIFSLPYTHLTQFSVRYVSLTNSRSHALRNANMKKRKKTIEKKNQYIMRKYRSMLIHAFSEHVRVWQQTCGEFSTAHSDVFRSGGSLGQGLYKSKKEREREKNALQFHDLSLKWSKCNRMYINVAFTLWSM